MVSLILVAGVDRGSAGIDPNKFGIALQVVNAQIARLAAVRDDAR